MNRKGLKELSRESFLQNVTNEVLKRGVKTIKIRQGGLTVENITEYAKRQRFSVNLRDDGVTLDIAKQKAA